MNRLLSVLLSVALLFGGAAPFALALGGEEPDESIADMVEPMESMDPMESMNPMESMDPMESAEPEPIIMSFYQEGLEFTIPDELEALGACEVESYYLSDGKVRDVSLSLYTPALRNLIDEIIMAMYDESSEYETVNQMQENALKLYKQLLTVRVYYKEDFEAEMADDKTLSELVGAENADILGDQDGMVYIIFEPENDVSELDEESLALYDQCLEFVSQVRQNVRMIPVQEAGAIDDKVPDFSASDLNDNTVTNDIFKGKKVTMINIWGTFCGPCIDEMPDLGELSRSLPDEAQIVGLIVDIDGDNNLQLAKDIVSGANADFTHIIADSVLLDFTQFLVGVPTSIFVDENGVQIGEPILGSRAADVYRAAIEEFLN